MTPPTFDSRAVLSHTCSSTSAPQRLCAIVWFVFLLYSHRIAADWSNTKRFGFLVFFFFQFSFSTFYRALCIGSTRLWLAFCFSVDRIGCGGFLFCLSVVVVRYLQCVPTRSSATALIFRIAIRQLVFSLSRRQIDSPFDCIFIFILLFGVHGAIVAFSEKIAREKESQNKNNTFEKRANCLRIFRCVPVCPKRKRYARNWIKIFYQFAFAVNFFSTFPHLTWPK